MNARGGRENRPLFHLVGDQTKNKKSHLLYSFLIYQFSVVSVFFCLLRPFNTNQCNQAEKRQCLVSLGVHLQLLFFFFQKFRGTGRERISVGFEPKVWIESIDTQQPPVATVIGTREKKRKRWAVHCSGRWRPNRLRCRLVVLKKR